MKSIYSRWSNMKQRCYNPNHHSYHNYGGRGITICDEWKDNFKSYFDYVMSLPNAMKSNYVLDREDNDGNYEPGNLRWVTPKIQRMNQRKKPSQTGFTGIDLYEMKYGYRYRPIIVVDGKKIYLESHRDLIAAVISRDQYIIDNGLSKYPLQLLNNK